MHISCIAVDNAPGVAYTVQVSAASKAEARRLCTPAGRYASAFFMPGTERLPGEMSFTDIGEPPIIVRIGKDTAKLIGINSQDEAAHWVRRCLEDLLKRSSI